MSHSPVLAFPSHHRRTSGHSINSTSSLTRSQSRPLSFSASSPTTSRAGSIHDAVGTLADEFAELDDGEALDILDDELDEWSEEEDGDRLEDVQADSTDAEIERDSGIDVASSSPPDEKSIANGANAPHPPTTLNSSTRRKQSRQYDGSEYGSESDLEETELVSASLEARLASIEALARRGIDEGGNVVESSIGRFTERLKDLGGQTGIENGVTRLTTAHSALTVHLGHQSRILQRLTSTLVSPFGPLPDADLVEDLLPQIDSTLEYLTGITPASQPRHGLHNLYVSSVDLTQNLAYLTDSLHVNRQSTTGAARKLRAVRDVLAVWRQEWTMKEMGIKHVERGQWENRLRERKCAAECRNIMKGFEEKCDLWRDRLVRSQVGAG